MRQLAIFALAAATIAAAPRPARQPSTDALVDKAVAAHGRLKTVRARFEQRLVNPLSGTTIVQKGELQQRLPNHLAVTFTDPKGDRIVADGKAVWVYTPSSAPKQVLRLPIGAGSAGGLDLAAQFFASPKTRYTITAGDAATLEGRATRALSLVPKQQGAFRKAIVWIDTEDGTLRQFEVTEHSGLVRKVTLTAIRPNASVDASAFRFSVPSGVKVYDQAAMMGGR